MAGYVYTTPEWLEQVAKAFREDPTNKPFFERRTRKGLYLCYCVKADSKFGLESDIYWYDYLNLGELLEKKFVSAEEARIEKPPEYLLFTSPPSYWKQVIQKKAKFVTGVVTAKIIVEVGEKMNAIALGAYADKLVESYNRVETTWPDEMSPTELEKHKAYVKEFRQKLGI
jgi:hypothetical protein